MGEEAFEEVVLVSRRGKVFVRGGYGRANVWLGVSTPGESDPLVAVEMTPHMIRRLVVAMLDMCGDDEAEPGELIGETSCPSCGTDIEIVHGDEHGKIGAIS